MRSPAPRGVPTRTKADSPLFPINQVRNKKCAVLYVKSNVRRLRCRNSFAACLSRNQIFFANSCIHTKTKYKITKSLPRNFGLTKNTVSDSSKDGNTPFQQSLIHRCAGYCKASQNKYSLRLLILKVAHTCVLCTVEKRVRIPHVFQQQ